MAHTEIEYCVPHGLLLPPLKSEEALFNEFGRKFDEVAVTTGTGLTLSIRIDEDRRHDNQHDGPEINLNQLNETTDSQVTVAV